MLDEIGGRLRHAAAQARRTEAAALAAESHQVLHVACVALHPREAAAQQATIEVAFELSAHEWWQRRSIKTRCDGGVECLDVVTDDCVERGGLGAAALVAARAASVLRKRS